MANYAGKTSLAYLWGKIKAYVSSAISETQTGITCTHTDIGERVEWSGDTVDGETITIGVTLI